MQEMKPRTKDSRKQFGADRVLRVGSDVLPVTGLASDSQAN